MLRSRPVLLAAGAVAAWGVVSMAPAMAATTNVTVADNVFQAATVTVTAGDTVVWTQPGTRVHNVTADDGSFGSGNLAAGGTFSQVFATPGTYRYHCTIHGAPGGIGMSGVVVVQAAQATTTTAATTTTTVAPTTTTTAAGAATTTTAAPTTTTTAPTRVLSASATAGQAAAGQPSQLASTGLITGPLVAIAVALLLTGAVLVRRAATMAPDEVGG